MELNVQGGVESLNLEVFKERLDMAHSAVGLLEKVMTSQRLGLMISEVFSNLIDSVICFPSQRERKECEWCVVSCNKNNCSFLPGHGRKTYWKTFYIRPRIHYFLVFIFTYLKIAGGPNLRVQSQRKRNEGVFSVLID